MKTSNLRTVTLDQIIDLPVHPVADLFPMLSEEAVTDNKRPEGLTLRELAESIRDNGLQEPIVLLVTDEGTLLLDGRNRRQGCIRAAKMLGVKPSEFEIQVEDFIGSPEEEDEFVFALNLDRRHLTTGQRAFIAVKLGGLKSQGQRAELVKSLTSDNDLCDRFRISRPSIIEARRHVRALEDAEAAIESARLEIERQKAVEAEAKAELEAAKEVGDTSRVKDAAHKASNAASVVSDEQEKLEAKAQVFSQKSAKINRVTSGKESLNSLKEASPGQTIKADDPLAKFRSSLNSACNNVREAAKQLLDGGRPEDEENVRLKIRDLWLEFGNLDPVEGLVDVDEIRASFESAEVIASDHGQKMKGSGKAVAPQTKDCGCNFSGIMTCEACI